MRKPGRSSVPDAPGLELILAEINRTESGAVIDTSFDREQASLVVDATKVISVLTWLKETPGQEYTFLSSVHGVDYYPNTPRFAVHYELLNRERYERLRVKALLADPAAQGAGEADIAPVAAVPAEDVMSGSPAHDQLPHLASCVDLFPTAEFQEREVYDFFGVFFDGHPDMRRILMPDDYVGWPQRRDFPVGGEPVIFTKDEIASPGWWQ
ncbi:MAG: NADH-quinone oxidoreductase subunit C [Solirubrobacterales bacterium]|nr:NADH-quinone oxidoreductase subunit C [Solirubrobacterales bacterium]